MSERTGWLEKQNNGRVVSMVEVKYHRVKIKKTSRKNGKNPVPNSSYRDESLYYVLAKNTSYGEMYLTAGSVFSKNEIIELELFVARYRAKLRLLAKVKKTETFHELKRPLFRGDLQFAAVNKYDFENIKALEEQRLREETAFRNAFAQQAKTDAPPPNSMRLTFKRG
ncbi:MAG TPA: hypothetical protein VJ873_08470 [bacterium]|nr:hypothetical protein [bacterium]